MKKYSAPELEVLVITNTQVITTSGDGDITLDREDF